MPKPVQLVWHSTSFQTATCRFIIFSGSLSMLLSLKNRTQESPLLNSQTVKKVYAMLDPKPYWNYRDDYAGRSSLYMVSSDRFNVLHTDLRTRIDKHFEKRKCQQHLCKNIYKLFKVKLSIEKWKHRLGMT